MAYGIKLHISGDFACFTRPEIKVQRVSYDIMTPSAARGILAAIYWKPQFQWVVEKIHVLKPIRWTSVRRNEVGRKATAPSAKVTHNGFDEFGKILPVPSSHLIGIAERLSYETKYFGPPRDGQQWRSKPLDPVEPLLSFRSGPPRTSSVV